MDTKTLLTDEFLVFSQKVGEVSARIKECKAEFQAKMKSLTAEADALRVDFETWQSTSAKSTEPVEHLPSSKVRG